MFIEEGIVCYLQTCSLLVTIVTDRIYPSLLPQKPTLPAIVFQRIATQYSHSMGGDSGFVSAVYQFDCYAKSYSEVKKTSREMRIALQNFTGKMGESPEQPGIMVQAVLVDNEMDDYEEQTKLYRITMDFTFQYEEAM